jgi:hypothetical protein
MLETRKGRIDESLRAAIAKDDKPLRVIFAEVPDADFWKLKTYLTKHKIKMTHWLREMIKGLEE